MKTKTSKTIGSLFALLFLVGSLQADDRPNIIYLMTDDQAYNTMAIYGNSDVKTPNMDKLGRDGVIFDRHYNTTSICMASRANVMTGMYEYKTGTNFQHGNMKPEVWKNSYPILLREAGYYTAFAGKFGFDVDEYNFKVNGGEDTIGSFFDLWGGGRGQTSYQTARNESMAKYAEKYPHASLSYGAFGQDVIKAAVAANKPFCLSISFKAPHNPIEPDPKFDYVYRDATFTKPVNFGPENGTHLAEQSKQGRQVNSFRAKYTEKYNETLRQYHQLIYAVDVAVGMIRDELEAQGVAGNTVIIFTSDNGYSLGAHGYGGKVLPHEEASRAPLMILDPRSATAGKGLRSPALTGNIDFAPTMLELAGVPVPENMDGVSLLPLLEDPRADVREDLAVFNMWGSEPSFNMTMVTKDWKYTYWWYGDNKMKPVEALFDLGNDPLEMTDLANNPEAAPTLEDMRAKYDKQLEHFKANVVEYNNYSQYPQLFDRSIPWQAKEFERVLSEQAKNKLEKKRAKKKAEKEGKKKNSKKKNK